MKKIILIIDINPIDEYMPQFMNFFEENLI